jgi:hypothetical protein
MANPIPVFVSTFVAGLGVAQSGFATFSFSMSSGWEAWVEVKMTIPGTTSISAGAEVTIYRSVDGGVTYETDGTPAGVFKKPTVASQVQKKDVCFGPGQYLVSVMVGGGAASTWTAQLMTAWELTSYN